MQPTWALESALGAALLTPTHPDPRSHNRCCEGVLGAALLVQAAAGAAEAIALHRFRRQVRRHQQRGRLRSTQVQSATHIFQGLMYRALLRVLHSSQLSKSRCLQ